MDLHSWFLSERQSRPPLQRPSLPPPMAPDRPPSMLQICLGLSYIFVIGWTCIGVPTVVLPR